MISTLLTIPEFAERIRVSKSLAYKLIAEQRVRHVRIGTEGKGAIRIPEDAIPEFLRSCEVQPLWRLIEQSTESE